MYTRLLFIGMSYLEEINILSLLYIKMPFSTYVSGLTFAFGITFDRNNNLYIATGPANNIIKVDTSGNQSVFASGFNFTQNVVFDNVGLYLYVMDSSNTIYKVDATGTVTTFVTNLNAHYFGMAFDSHNNLYYSSVDNNRIYKIDPSGITTIFINGEQQKPSFSEKNA